jgi:copper chaperone NosL
MSVTSQNEMSKASRLLLGVTSLAVIAVFFLPLWQIQLWAPQYPEGLNMKIWHNRLSGAFDIINGLNHYIGMREIHANMFPELSYLVYLIAFYIAFGLFAAIRGRKSMLYAFAFMGILYGALALYDFYRWGYDYGHNLDPHAAIQVPGMSYQPPVIGYKNLLNFTAYSGPDSGGWIIIVSATTALMLAAWEFKKGRKTRTASARLAYTVLIVSVLSLAGCGEAGPAPIRFGQDQCHSCKMTITDQRFGCELVNTTRKVFKFDDLSCMLAFVKQGEIPEEKIAQYYVVDYLVPGSLIDAKSASYIFSTELKSPMRGDMAAFTTTVLRDSVMSQLHEASLAMSWDEINSKP